MGWSSETYRYRQYKNAIKYIREHHGNLDLKAKIEPRADFSLLDTLLEGLRELVREYEAVAILRPEDEHDDRWFECSECGARLSPLYWEEAPDEWTTCPSCGRRFRGEHILEEMGIHTRRCEVCGHCLSDGYEYPESYCELGIGDDDPKYDGEGCYYTKTQRKELCKKAQETNGSLWWDENEKEEQPDENQED